MRRYIIILFSFALIACDNYGARMELENGELYYTDAVTPGEADRLGQYLKTEHFFENEKSMQLHKEEGVYYLNLIATDPENPAPEETTKALDDLAIILSEKVFEGAEVVITICDSNFVPLSEINP